MAKNEEGQRSNSVPAARGKVKKLPSLVATEEDDETIEVNERKMENKALNQHSSEVRIDLNPGKKLVRSRPPNLIDEEETPKKLDKQMTPVAKDNSGKNRIENKPNTSSQTLLTDGPLNTY